MRMLGKCIGILISDSTRMYRMPDSRFLYSLCKAGLSLGISVFMFSPADVNWGGLSIAGHTLDINGHWITRAYPLPLTVYNRSFSQNIQQYQQQIKALRELKSRGSLIINTGLKGKWDVHRALQKDPAIRPYLPRTIKYQGPQTLRLWFQQYQEAFLKPHSGSQGKGTMHIEQEPTGSYIVSGRNFRNERLREHFVDLDRLSVWVQRWVRSRIFLVQEYLDLNTIDGYVYDIRVLVQKNGEGRWQTTGMAVRKGAQGSSTSNLHGGGSALPVSPFLKQEYGSAAASRIVNTLNDLAGELPVKIEGRFGRFCELGLDFGVDKGGRVWLLEVNSKPGRSVFRKLRMKQERIHSIVNPLLYASYLMEHQAGPMPSPTPAVFQP
jgi:glutathione synthase/RimK-type ligase-like ATP-grasp enzyme